MKFFLFIVFKANNRSSQLHKKSPYILHFSAQHIKILRNEFEKIKSVSISLNTYYEINQYSKKLMS